MQHENDEPAMFTLHLIAQAGISDTEWAAIRQLKAKGKVMWPDSTPYLKNAHQSLPHNFMQKILEDDIIYDIIVSLKVTIHG